MDRYKYQLKLGVNSLKSELENFISDIQETTKLNPKDDPFMFSFLLLDKTEYFDKLGYKWLFLDEQLNKIEPLMEEKSDDYYDIRDFVYLGDFNIDLKKCSGAAWRVAQRGKNSIMAYNLNENFGDYYGGEDNKIYRDEVLEQILKIEKELWAPPHTSSGSNFYIIQKEIYRSDNEIPKEFFSLQIVGRLSEKDFTKNYQILTKLFKRLEYKISSVFQNIVYQRSIYKSQLKTAIISILVDSFAHNISAHSLAALKWWFEKRTLEYDKRINLGNNNDKKLNIVRRITGLKPNNFDNAFLKRYANISDHYFRLLGLDDSSNDKNYTSLMEIVKLIDEEHEKELLRYSTIPDENSSLYYRYPVPIDFALEKLIRFLRDKAAFWSGVTRDLPFGGQVINLYSFLWNEFADNPLSLGTIAHSEGIHKININVELPRKYFDNGISYPKAIKFKNDKIDYVSLEFAIVDMSVIEFEDRLYNSNQPQLNNNIQYYSAFIYEDDISEDFLHSLLSDSDSLTVYLRKQCGISQNIGLKVSDKPKIRKKLNELIQNQKLWNILDGSTLEEKYRNIINDNSIDLIVKNRRFLDEYYNGKIRKSHYKINYSKYALVYPGKFHKDIRLELQKDVYNLFLPGGVVGKHSLLTIFENTIRNIKHFNVDEDIKKNGLNFNIRITPAELMSEEIPELGKSKHKLFKIGVFLYHKNEIYKIKIDDKSNKPALFRIKNYLEKHTSKPIVDENGLPRLGGNSQDKICAAMLLNNKFISVNPQETSLRDQYYYNEEKKYYWIGFDDNSDFNKVKNTFEEIIKTCKEKFNSLNDDEINQYNINKKYTDIERKKEELFNNYFMANYSKKKFNNVSYGFIMKYFYLWKGDFILSISSKENFKNENISRFKFIFVEKDEIDDETQRMLLNEGVIRILTKKDFIKSENDYNKFIKNLEYESEKNYESLSKNIQQLLDKVISSKHLFQIEKYFIYRIWLKKFIDNKSIRFFKCSSRYGTSDNKPSIIISDFQLSRMGNISNDYIDLYFHHSGETYNVPAEKIINYRSHGWMRENIFSNDDFRFHNIDDTFAPSHPIFEEFIELLLTKVCIIDKRIYDRINKENREKFKNLLNLEVCNEFRITESSKEKEEWKEIKAKLSEYNFLIVHLSFIESLGYYEEKINDFFDYELNFENKIPEHFYVIIVTGRGRSRWLEFINPKYKKITLFRPIEALLDAIEQGIGLRDDIQVKYYLSKIIYGS